MVKILHLLFYYYPSEIGGPANSLYWINNNISLKEFEIQVIATTCGIQSVENAKEHYKKSSQQVVFTSPNLFKFFIKALQKVKGTDILQFSSLFFKLTLPLLIIGFFLRKKIILSPRGELYDSALSIKTKSKKVWILLIRMFQKSIHFHATNETEKALIQKFFPKHKSIQIIPNFIDLPEKEEVTVKNQFIFIGRVNPIKNIDLLIEAFSEFIKQEKATDYELLILGEARLPYELKYKEELLVILKDKQIKNVKFLGHVDGKYKLKLIAESKALFLVSKSENFGNVVTEALSQGTPVVASKGTPWQILEEEKIGFWISATKEEVLKAMINVDSIKPAEYQLMRENAYEVARSKFEIKANIKTWEEYYKNI